MIYECCVWGYGGREERVGEMDILLIHFFLL